MNYHITFKAKCASNVAECPIDGDYFNHNVEFFRPIK